MTTGPHDRLPLRVIVVGGGVIGLTIAREFVRRGDTVTVVADRPAADAVSAVAGAIWFPYETDTSPTALRMIELSRRSFEALAEDPATGVDLRRGVLVERRPDADRAWTGAVEEFQELPPEDLPVGATGGVAVTLPVISVPEYLQWLTGECLAGGVEFRSATVHDLDDLAEGNDLVVVAAGLRSGELLGDDDTSYPIRGQVVRLANPGLTEWLIDDDHPDGVTYVIPRREDIVCGGTAEPGEVDTTWNAETERRILQRATALVPELAGLSVVSRAVGLRPARPGLRIEEVEGYRIRVLTCYGHGGAGVSLSWGCAAEVLELAHRFAPEGAAR